MSPAEHANQRLVDCLIADGALWSPTLMAAFRATPRHRFLDRVFQYQPRQDRWREVLTRDASAEELRIVYADRALITHLSPPAPGASEVPISSSSQPSLMAQMLEDLHLAVGMRVLEIGAGTGYNAALLAHVIGPDRVVSIDVDRNVLSEACAHLQAFPARQVRLKHADGRAGYPEAAPYDRIMATAATPDLEPAWLEQLRDGGLLCAPLTLAPGLAFVACGTVRAGAFEGRLLRPAYFMPLRAEGESGANAEGMSWLGGDVQSAPAPWAGWFDRRRARRNWLRFVQALAFYGLLHGYAVQQRSSSSGQPIFGLHDREAGGACWYGVNTWEFNGAAGQRLAWAMWDRFQAAGAPWPTEFRFRAGPAPLPLSGAPEEYARQGRRCFQVWQVLETRER